VIKIRTDEALLKDLFTVMKNIEDNGKLIGNDLVFQTSNKFITSATVATKPGSRGSISGTKLPAKSRIRRIVTIGAGKQKSSNKNYYFDFKTGKIRVWRKSITPRMQEKMNIVRITKFIEAINRKTGKFYYIPLKPHEVDGAKSDKRARIPKAGSAKAGWLAARRKLNAKGERDIRDISPNVNKTVRQKGTDPYIFMQNNVRYITRISPNSARIGLSKAARAMEQQFLPKAERLITKSFNERRKSTLARTGIVIR
jgi:hypothetical protein